MLIKQKFRNRLPDFLKIQNRAHSQGINKVFICLSFCFLAELQLVQAKSSVIIRFITAYL